MAVRSALVALLGAVAAVVALVVAAPGSAAPAEPVRIMALGDSITGSPGCWRALLDRDLRAAGHTAIDFVGTLPGQGCGFPYDGENEGHGGYLATNVADQNQLVGWLAQTHPHVVLMHFGTNDVWNNRSPSTILAAFGKLVDQMRADNPDVKVLVAQIIPMNPANCAECAQRVVDLNAAIPGWAAAKSTARSPVTVVDQWTGFSTSADTGDGVHPNASGDRKIADRWFPALVNALGGVSPTSTTTTTTTTSPGVACDAVVKVVNKWPGGFQVEVTFTNRGTTPTSGWSVGFALNSGMTVAQVWSGTVSQSGLNLTVRNASWNGQVAPAGSATVGMIVNGDPTGWNPVPICSLS
ncbi:cellulose binding domain-containing protein [Saccharothrix variisporea]|uniref:GDSL-like lipase/acylhydrolase family protein n=1 Tax=Saccharothrix variisporea TaxID=543527 RepID=A0A495X6T6_9PSEU|nr:cellulose binding domain-containing protein [Saccharothrix variisporea]RKT68724.1 GDSL-like lipase/acylhydrolase family protein [Saccharothrix variisporea]